MKNEIFIYNAKILNNNKSHFSLSLAYAYHIFSTYN